MTAATPQPSPGTRVTFNHAVLGDLTGGVWRILSDSKMAVVVYLAEFDSHYLFHVNQTDLQE